MCEFSPNFLDMTFDRVRFRIPNNDLFPLKMLLDYFLLFLEVGTSNRVYFGFVFVRSDDNCYLRGLGLIFPFPCPVNLFSMFSNAVVPMASDLRRERRGSGI